MVPTRFFPLQTCLGQQTFELEGCHRDKPIVIFAVGVRALHRGEMYTLAGFEHVRSMSCETRHGKHIDNRAVDEILASRLVSPASSWA